VRLVVAADYASRDEELAVDSSFSLQDRDI
jgi:hypothetical protein